MPIARSAGEARSVFDPPAGGFSKRAEIPSISQGEKGYFVKNSRASIVVMRPACALFQREEWEPATRR